MGISHRAASLNTQLLHFLVVILAIQNVPLLRAFQDGALLALDFMAGGLVNPLFVVAKHFEDLPGFLADGIGVFDEIDFVHLLQRVGDGSRQHVYFVAAQSHSTALYLRTSSLFTLRNISW